jgi:hypothetical protein
MGHESLLVVQGPLMFCSEKTLRAMTVLSEGMRLEGKGNQKWSGTAGPLVC